MAGIDEEAEDPVRRQHADHEEAFQHVRDARMVLAVARDEADGRVHGDFDQCERDTHADIRIFMQM